MPLLPAAVVALLLVGPPAPDPELARGLAQVRARDYARGEETLQAVVRRVYGRPAAAPTLVQAYVGLGVASVGQDRRDGARDWFAEALALDPKLRLGTDEPEEAVRLFEEVRRARDRSAAPERKAARKRRTLVALGAAAAVGGVAAGAVALAPESKPTLFTSARLATHEIACPTGITSVEVPIVVLVDVVPPDGTVEVRTASVAVIPVEALFLRAGVVQTAGPTTVVPMRLGPGPTTLTAETVFGCSRLGTFSTARTELWRAGVTLVTSIGSYFVQTQDQLKVEFR